jgi:hypothetical protein
VKAAHLPVADEVAIRLTALGVVQSLAVLQLDDCVAAAQHFEFRICRDHDIAAYQ